MQPSYLPLFDHVPAALLKVMPLAVFALVFLLLLRLLERKFGWRSQEHRGRPRRVKRSSGWSSNARRHPTHHAVQGKVVPDAADQLRIVMASEFTAQPLLNRSEKRLFEALDKLVIELAPPGWQVMAQVCLGEILKSPSKDAFLAINSKRVDLLIVDAEAKPRHAIEYQGGGHFKDAHSTAARDAVKKEALRRAGIGYVEVVGGEMNAVELRAVVEKLVGGMSISFRQVIRRSPAGPAAIRAAGGR